MLKKNRYDDLLLLTIETPRLTAANAPTFRQAVFEIVAAGDTRLVLDMKDVSFVDSTGLGALVGVLKQMGTRGELAICSLQRPVEQMFKLTRMDRVFRIFADADAARAAIELA